MTKHVCSFDVFTTGGKRNFKVQIYYFGFLLLKATYLERERVIISFRLSFTKNGIFFTP